MQDIKTAQLYHSKKKWNWNSHLYTYIYTYLKNQRFYPDFNLWIKLIWELQSKEKKDELKQEICIRVYGLDDH